MPKFHNLEGWMRDVKRAVAEGDEIAYNVAELILELDGLVDDEVGSSGGGESEDDGGSASDGGTTEVAGDRRQLSLPVSGKPRRPAAGSKPGGTPASALDRALDYLAGEERSEAVAELDLLRMHSMGAPRVAAVKPRARGTK